MSAGLEERFEHLKKEKEKDLVQESKATSVEILDLGVTVPEKKLRLRRILKELAFFLGAAGIAVLLGLGFWQLFADNILGSKFDPGPWEPPDEQLGGDARVHIKTGIWRAGLGLVVYSLVSLLGVYLTRVVIWAVTHILPALFDDE